MGMKNPSVCYLRMGSSVVFWYSRNHKSISLSYVEEKYISTIMVTCESIWIWKLLVALFGQSIKMRVIHSENKSCKRLFENLVFHERSKHIDIRYHFIRDFIKCTMVQLQYIPKNQQVVEILTKALGKERFIFFRDKLGVMKNTLLSNRECQFVQYRQVFQTQVVFMRLETQMK